MSEKILHDFASNEEARSFTGGQVTAAQQAIDDTVTANNVTAAALGPDVAGSEGQLQTGQTMFQRHVEFGDLAQVQSKQQGLADDIQRQAAVDVARLFGPA